jgi:NAD+ synthase (glutamine-hydrolysing)
VGYCTLYGDMAGGFSVIKDLVKGQVYALCRERNQQPGGPVIPERILTRAPSAELKPNQTDQDSLPPYDALDDMLVRYVEQGQSRESLISAGHQAQTVDRVLRLIRISEYKRRQAAPGIRITPRAFGRDWRYPLTNGFTEQ